MAVTLAALLAALSKADLLAVRQAVSVLPASRLALVFGILTAGALLAAVRLKWMFNDIGVALGVREALAATSLGQIGAALFFQFFGQLAARSAYLAPRGISVSANIVINLYERAIAAGVSLLLALAGGWFLFGRLVLDMKYGGAQFVHILAGLAVAFSAGGMLAWGRLAVARLRPLASGRTALLLLRTAMLTLAIQALTAVAYLVAARSLAPQADTLEVAAAIFIVMFAASLPVSFAGWGVRELSAVFALNFVGISPAAAIGTALIVGAAGLLAVVVLAAVCLAIPAPAQVAKPLREEQLRSEHDLGAALALLLPLAAATLLFFQIHIPTGSTPVNVNFADPIAILTGIVLSVLVAKGVRPQWRVSWLNLHILVATGVMVFAWVHGYLRFGWSEWAFTNKLLGWFVLLGYGAAGALIVRTGSREGLVILLTTFVAVAAGIVLLETVLHAAAQFQLAALPRASVMQGFSGNRNAFGFLMLLAVCGVPFLRQRIRVGVLALLILGIWLSGSRSCIGAVVIVGVVLAATGALSLRDLGMALLAFGGALVVLAMLPWAAKWSNVNVAQSYPILTAGLLSPASDAERLRSLSGGIELYLENPMIGAGLGAFMESQIKSGSPLVIHSTPIWLLAEFGIVGTLAMIAPLVRAFLAEARHVRDDVSAFLISILIAFAVVSMVHEVLYQRAFWLLLGAALACVPNGGAPGENATG